VERGIKVKFLNWIKNEKNHIYVVVFFAFVTTCVILGAMCSLLGGIK
jgi:hypothetical protein